MLRPPEGSVFVRAGEQSAIEGAELVAGDAGVGENRVDPRRRAADGCDSVQRVTPAEQRQGAGLRPEGAHGSRAPSSTARTAAKFSSSAALIAGTYSNSPPSAQSWSIKVTANSLLSKCQPSSSPSSSNMTEHAPMGSASQ